jgi:hypothetical protein
VATSRAFIPPHPHVIRIMGRSTELNTTAVPRGRSGDLQTPTDRML